MRENGAAFEKAFDSRGRQEARLRFHIALNGSNRIVPSKENLRTLAGVLAGKINGPPLENGVPEHEVRADIEVLRAYLDLQVKYAHRVINRKECLKRCETRLRR